MNARVCVCVCFECGCARVRAHVHFFNGVILVAYIRIKSKKYLYYNREREFCAYCRIVQSNTWSNRNIFRKLSSILLQLCVCMSHIVRHYSTYFIWKTTTPTKTILNGICDWFWSRNPLYWFKFGFFSSQHVELIWSLSHIEAQALSFSIIYKFNDSADSLIYFLFASSDTFFSL